MENGELETDGVKKTIFSGQLGLVVEYKIEVSRAREGGSTSRCRVVGLSAGGPRFCACASSFDRLSSWSIFRTDE